MNLRYFTIHYCVIVKPVNEEMYFGVSGGNIFNTDLSLPVFRGKPFHRLTHVLMADSLEAVLSLIQELEGGVDWYDRTEHLNEDFYIDIGKKHSADQTRISLKKFITRWKVTSK